MSESNKIMNIRPCTGDGEREKVPEVRVMCRRYLGLKRSSGARIRTNIGAIGTDSGFPGLGSAAAFSDTSTVAGQLDRASSHNWLGFEQVWATSTNFGPHSAKQNWCDFDQSWGNAYKLWPELVQFSGAPTSSGPFCPPLLRVYPMYIPPTDASYRYIQAEGIETSPSVWNSDEDESEADDLAFVDSRLEQADATGKETSYVRGRGDRSRVVARLSK